MRNKGEKAKYLNEIASAIDLPYTSVSGSFRVELFENTEMLIENHKGIIEYEPERIKINCGKIIMTVEGEELAIVSMNGGGISLKGKILSIGYSS